MYTCILTAYIVGGGTRGGKGATHPLPDFKRSNYVFAPSPQISTQEINQHQLGIVLCNNTLSKCAYGKVQITPGLAQLATSY